MVRRLRVGVATGWPGTDWIEDLVLRNAGPDVYDQWVKNEIPFTDRKSRRRSTPRVRSC